MSDFRQRWLVALDRDLHLRLGRTSLIVADEDFEDERDFFVHVRGKEGGVWGRRGRKRHLRTLTFALYVVSFPNGTAQQGGLPTWCLAGVLQAAWGYAKIRGSAKP